MKVLPHHNTSLVGMPDDDGHKQCSTDVIVKERLGKFEAVQALMLVMGGGTTDVIVQEFVTKYEVVRHC
ncbi:unnamed protein product [Brassica oleracea]